MNVVAIKELLWSWHPLPTEWTVVPYADKATINSADVLVQSNQSGSKKEKNSYVWFFNFVIGPGPAMGQHGPA